MSSRPTVRALPDPRLEARVVRRTPLRYGDGACATEDRPAFVRAASGVTFLGDELVVVQDDASFVAHFRPGETARVVALPRAPSGRRQFSDALGNKRDKLDLEIGVTIPTSEGERVLAFGSGSLPVRERIVVLHPDAEPTARVIDATKMYAALRDAAGISKDDMNLEGAVVVGDVLRFFQRGNGDGTGSTPVPTTIDVDLVSFLAWLADPTAALPHVRDVARYDLGEHDGARFGFTDATCLTDVRVAYLASAERSPDVVRDGEVVGSVVGWIEGTEARWAPLLDEEGRWPPWKAEGIALDPRDPSRAWIVLDPDDPSRPAELCETRLQGPWRA